ncbi:glutamate--tRNA ligase family protein [uncultured Chitinophaga sp.]|uniref:glutamate--tRNA ligase family protein n=1 Tax=uncultured Chitinophaga sp. TaxID=339340 RepID=UPI0025EB35BF|nr:glutamate--tRNA ligase family protein [uncultured Chitinophaga sp.]
MAVPAVYKKTRIAPTPSGYLHLGNILSFAITATLAKQTKAATMLRIDDLDRDRAAPEYIQDIFDTLEFLDIPWAEGPKSFDEYQSDFSQLHRLYLYNAALEQLRPYVFACNCSRAQIARQSTNGAYPGTCLHKNIPLDTDGVSWRLITDNRAITIRDKQDVLPADMQYFVVRKKDGYPAYQLSSVIDDQHFGIDLIVRGLDLWNSTLAQLYLSSLLPGNTFHQTQFYHHPLLLEKDGGKLSKSAGSTSIQFLRNEGKSAADVYTMIANRLGGQSAVNWEELGQWLLSIASPVAPGNHSARESVYRP